MHLSYNNQKILEEYIDQIFSGVDNARKLASIVDGINEAIYDYPSLNCAVSDLGIFINNPYDKLPQLEKIDSKFLIKIATINLFDQKIDEIIDKMPKLDQFHFDEDQDYDISLINWNYRQARNHIINNENNFKQYSFEDLMLKFQPSKSPVLKEAEYLNTTKKHHQNCIT